MKKEYEIDLRIVRKVRVKIIADDETIAQDKALELYNQGKVTFPTASVLEIMVVNPRGARIVDD
jgi:hypothetical protein